MPPNGDNTNVSADDVRHVAALCRLELSDEQVAVEIERLSEILGYMQRLGKIGECHSPEITPAKKYDLRGDVPGPTLDADAVRDLSPASWNGFIRVPKILGEGSGS